MPNNQTFTKDALDNVMFVFEGDNPDPYVRCELCGEDLCTAEHKDSLGLIADVAADHLRSEHGM